MKQKQIIGLGVAAVLLMAVAVFVSESRKPAQEAPTAGPVQTFELFDSDAEAVHRANATEYGLGAAVFTRKPGRAHAIGRGLQTAGVWINTWGLLNEKFEQGGFKASSNGGFLCGPRPSGGSCTPPGRPRPSSRSFRNKCRR